MKCGVLVHQKGSEFIRSSNKTHCHPPKIGAKEAAKLAIKSKKEGVKQPFTPAEKIIRDVIRSEISPANCGALPDMQCMIRNVNNYRQKQRPAEPISKNFDLVIESIPEDFLLEDLRWNEEQSIIFATKQQLKLLKLAKTWFIDGTFKFVKPPFIQLFSIHAFVKSNDEIIQLSLAFCLMSRRQVADYKAIFEVIGGSFDQGVTTVRFGTELRYGTVRFWQKVRYGITYGIFRKSTVRKYGIIFSVPHRTLSVLQ